MIRQQAQSEVFTTSPAELNKHANQLVNISITNPTGTDGRADGYVNLRVEDAVSGETLVDVEIPSGRWWRLCQGSQQTWPARVSNNLDRLGKQMQHLRIEVPYSVASHDADPADVQRDAYHVLAGHDGDWPSTYDSIDTPRQTNKQSWAVIFRRWVPAE